MEKNVRKARMRPIIENIEAAMKMHKLPNKAALARFVGLSRGCITKLLKPGAHAGASVIAAFSVAFPKVSADYFFVPAVTNECQQKATDAE